MSIGIKGIGANAGTKSWHRTEITSTGMWFKNAASGDLAFARLIGGGGGGGRPVAAQVGITGSGQGGHGAPCVERWIDISGVQSASVTIGDAGLGATTTATAGADGGATIFGTLFKGPGGRGGGYSTSGTTTTPYTYPVSGTGPTVGVFPSIPGAIQTDTVGYMHPQCTDTRPSNGTANTYPQGCAGGGSRRGPGGAGANGVAAGAGNAGSVPASGYGGGGGGGGGGSTNSGNGGNGKPGVFEIWEYY